MTPREIVAELDNIIVGQAAAKRAVGRGRCGTACAAESCGGNGGRHLPKNILMIGPTGVGKTEIARRLARLAGCHS